MIRWWPPEAVSLCIIEPVPSSLGARWLGAPAVAARACSGPGGTGSGRRAPQLLCIDASSRWRSPLGAGRGASAARRGPEPGAGGLGRATPPRWLAQPPGRFSTARPEWSREALATRRRAGSACLPSRSSGCRAGGLGFPKVARLGGASRPPGEPRSSGRPRRASAGSSRVGRGEGGGAKAARARGSRWRERQSPPPTFPGSAVAAARAAM